MYMYVAGSLYCCSTLYLLTIVKVGVYPGFSFPEALDAARLLCVRGQRALSNDRFSE